ncbi:hypothetical protein LCGC14_2973090, partial [marine sediment metagenome]
QRKYQNKRSELWFTAATWGQTGNLNLSKLPERKRDLITAQLMTVTYDFDAMSRRVVEKKKDIKERIGRSPDDADAFNLAYYVRGKEYRDIDFASADLHQAQIWAGPGGGVDWANISEGSGSVKRSWAVGRSTRRRFGR